MSTVSSSSFNSIKSFSASALDKTDKVLTKTLSIFSNNYIYTAVLVLLILYAPAAAPMISKPIAGILGNYAIKFIYVFLLSYLLSKSVKISLVTTVVIVVGIFVLKKFNNNERFDGSGSEVSEIVVDDKLQKEIESQNESESENESDFESEFESESELPQEPVINREEVIKPVVQVESEIQVPVAADLLSNVNAGANHNGALKPIVPEEIKQVIDNADIIDVCGSRLNKDGYAGFDQHSDNYSSL
jgi:hypothetical protein